MAKKIYTTPSVEIEVMLTDVIMASNLDQNDNVGDDGDWGIPEKEV